jgi:cell division protein FtsQ
LAVVFAALCFFPYFNIDEIQVNGIESLTQEQVIEICNLEKTHNLFAFNTIKAKNALKQNNYVEDVSFKKSLPHTLIINVEEYKVRGYIPYMNAYLYIDENGRVLDSRPDMQAQLPIVSGLKFDSFTIGEVLKTDNPQTYKAVKDMSALFTSYEMLSDVIKVDVSDTDNIHLYVNKVDVKFGSFEGANDKIVTLNEILKQMDTSVAGVLDLTATTPTFKYMS